MSNPSSDQLFRQAAEAEGGMSVSAGARVAHVRLALEAGRAVTVDLSDVPEERRSALVAVIREIVRLTAKSFQAGVSAAPDPSKSTR